MRLSLPLVLSGALLTLSACAPSGAPAPAQTAAVTPAAASTMAAATVAATPAVTAEPMLWFEPASLSTCEKTAKVMVHWDTRKVATAKVVEVKTLAPDGKEGLFTHAGRIGTRETGPWMKAGRVMILRNLADGTEIGRATLGGIPCVKK